MTCKEHSGLINSLSEHGINLLFNSIWVLQCYNQNNGRFTFDSIMFNVINMHRNKQNRMGIIYSVQFQVLWVKNSNSHYPNNFTSA